MVDTTIPDESNNTSTKGQTELEKFQEKFQDTTSTSSESESVRQSDGDKDQASSEVEAGVVELQYCAGKCMKQYNVKELDPNLLCENCSINNKSTPSSNNPISSSTNSTPSPETSAEDPDEGNSFTSRCSCIYGSSCMSEPKGEHGVW